MQREEAFRASTYAGLFQHLLKSHQIVSNAPFLRPHEFIFVTLFLVCYLQPVWQEGGRVGMKGDLGENLPTYHQISTPHCERSML